MSLSKFRCAKAVLFDMDGLLLDTENMYTLGTQTILSQYGKEYSWDFKAKLMGKRTDEVARMIVDHYQLTFQHEEWVMRSTAVYKELFPSVPTLPGVAKLVHHLAKSGVPIAVATISSSSAFELKTSNHSGLFSLFDHIVTGDHDAVKNAKPAPDIFLYAADKLGFKGELTQDCLVVEDAPLGVDAGCNAGMQVVMVPDKRLNPSFTSKATISLSNLHQLNLEQFGLPAYPYKPVTHVIFDMDGLLLNTQIMYSSVSARILAQHGKEPDYNFKMKVIGRRSQEVASMAVEHYQLPYTGEEYLQIHESELHALFPTCDLLPGVERLLNHLHQNKIKIAVATSSARNIMEMKTKLKHTEIFSLFDHIVTGCDPELEKSKPDPQIYDLARKRFADCPDAGSCLVFEDAPNGVEAGIAAGMQVVMIPHHKADKKYLMPATQLLSTMADFQPQDFGLPPFPSDE